MGILRTEGQVKDDKKGNVSPTFRNRVANIRQIKESIVCEHCHKLGHKGDDCFRETVCNYCQKQGHPENRCFKRKRDNSNRSGRTSPNDSTSQTKTGYKSPKKCSYCRNLGHIIFDCRKLKYQLEKRNQENGVTHKIASTESESESGPVEVKHIKQNNTWTAPCVTAASPRLREAVTLMIDTGADINLIKTKKLAKRTIINTKRIGQLTSISPDTQKTLGTVKLIIFGEKTTFHVVDNHFPISADGIIGNEFLRSTPTNIDYIREVLIVKNRRFPFTVSDKVGIPPRTSKVIFCHVINADVKDGYIPRIQLPMGVYAGEALVGNVDGRAYFRLINTTSRFVSLQIPKLELLAYNIETLPSLPYNEDSDPDVTADGTGDLDNASWLATPTLEDENTDVEISSDYERLYFPHARSSINNNIIKITENVGISRDSLQLRHDNIVIFTDLNGTPCDTGAKLLEQTKLIPHVKDLTLARAKNIARRNLVGARIRSKFYYDRSARGQNLKVGQYIYLLKQPTSKLGDQYTGPYQILEVLPKNNIKISYKNRTRIVHKDKVKICAK
ncbi:hypothetical protein M0804_015460 [Polistes exclamans]|nr:hypothetical protein M0804_015460 [Polistes exclamans]